MPPLRVLFPPAAALIGLILLGCGSSGEKKGDPAAAAKVRSAASRLYAQPFRARMVVNNHFSVVKGPPALAGRLAQLSAPTRVRAEFESARRVKAAVLAPPFKRYAYTVVYEGHTYLSPNGRTYKEVVGPIGKSTSSGVIQGRIGFIKGLEDVRDVGPTTDGGVPVEHFQGKLTANQIKQSIRAGALGPLAKLEPEAAPVDVYLTRRGGDIEGIRSRVKAKVGTSAALELGIDATTTLHTFGRGAPIHVVRPQSTGSVSTPQELATLLSQSPSPGD